MRLEGRRAHSVSHCVVVAGAGLQAVHQGMVQQARLGPAGGVGRGAAHVVPAIALYVGEGAAAVLARLRAPAHPRVRPVQRRPLHQHLPVSQHPLSPQRSHLGWQLHVDEESNPPCFAGQGEVDLQGLIEVLWLQAAAVGFHCWGVQASAQEGKSDGRAHVHQAEAAGHSPGERRSRTRYRHFL